MPPTRILEPESVLEYLYYAYPDVLGTDVGVTEAGATSLTYDPFCVGRLGPSTNVNEQRYFRRSLVRVRRSLFTSHLANEPPRQSARCKTKLHRQRLALNHTPVR